MTKWTGYQSPIGDYVGHKSPDSTRVYAKVDIESLREMALGLGEDLL